MWLRDIKTFKKGVLNMSSPRVISIVSGKGGVGKTTSSTNISTILAGMGYKVLGVDLDKQSNFTKQFKLYSKERASVCDVLLYKKSPDEVILNTSIDNLDILPATYELENIPDMILLDINNRREERLKSLLDTNYDFIIIDCPPSLDILVMNALVISDYILVPIKVDEWGIEGLENITNKMQIAQRSYNPKLKLLGTFVTCDNRTRLNKAVKLQLKELFKDKFFNTTIRNDKRVAESTFSDVPVVIIEPEAKVSIDYKELTKEVIAYAN